MAAPPLIGSTITLISKNEIRYEGILHDINKVDTTIALRDVRSFGTEDRAAPKFCAPQPQLYPFIKFRGADIRDLHVAPEKPPPPPPPVKDVITFGSIDVQPTPPPRPPPQPSLQPPAQGAPWSSSAAAQARGQNQGGSRPLPGMGAALANRRVRGGTGQVGDVTSDFDFERFNSEFDKAAEKAQVLAQTVVSKYNPSSFFDDLGGADPTPAGGYVEREQRAAKMSEERKKNAETFGATSLQDNRRGPRNGKGKGGDQGKGKGGSQGYREPHANLGKGQVTNLGKGQGKGETANPNSGGGFDRVLPRAQRQPAPPANFAAAAAAAASRPVAPRPAPAPKAPAPKAEDEFQPARNRNRNRKPGQNGANQNTGKGKGKGKGKGGKGNQGGNQGGQNSANRYQF